MLKIVIVIFTVLSLFNSLYCYISLKKIFNRNISTSNMIRFTKLKGFLNESSDEDIKDLISFLYQFLKRKKKL